MRFRGRNTTNRYALDEGFCRKFSKISALLNLPCKITTDLTFEKFSFADSKAAPWTKVWEKILKIQRAAESTK